MRSINFDKLGHTPTGAPRIRPSRPMAAVVPPDTTPEGSLTSIPVTAEGSLTSIPVATQPGPASQK